MEQPGIRVERSTVVITGYVPGPWREAVEKALAQASCAGGTVVLDPTGCEGMDPFVAASIHEQAVSRGASFLMRPDSGLARLFAVFDRTTLPEPTRTSWSVPSHFEGVGSDVLTAAETLRGLARFTIDSSRAFLKTVRAPRSFRWGLALYYMEQAGVNAVPIVAVLCWLLGTVLGYQSGYQLKTFGAEVFMPDLVGYMVTWGIGPLLAAILVAGRSSSAFAAEIGTMKVRQEVDALEVMGFDVTQFLVTPKLMALVVVMPALVLFADFFGLLGGLLIGGWYLDMPASVYMARLRLVMLPLDFLWGAGKGVVYATLVGNVGCFMGTRVRGGAAEVGKATTTAVVAAIFLVIVADALISLLLYVRIRPAVVV